MRLRPIAWVAPILLTVIGSGASAVDLSAMQPPAVIALQLRLAHAACYRGPIDGTVSIALAEAVEACPDQDPVLRIETGTHTAPIGRIGVDDGCHLMATASADKTIRLWSMPDGQLKRTIRLPIGEGNGGRLDAVALSPDGRTLAAGGWDAAEAKGKSDGVYVVDLRSGVVRRFGGLENVIHHLAFSADGKQVAVGLAAGGIRVFDRDSGKVLMADSHFGAPVYGVAFGPDRSLYATSYDGVVRRYAANLKPAGTVKAPGGAHPYAVAVERTGRRIAVGYEDKAAVSILDAATLKPLASGQTGDLVQGTLGNVAWRADGDQLLAGGDARAVFPERPKTTVLLRRLDPSGRRIPPDLAAADDTITDMKPCAQDIVFASKEPTLGLAGSSGDTKILQQTVTADMRGKVGDALTIGSDGAAVRFGLDEGGERPVLFDLAAGTLTEAPTPSPGFEAAIVDGLPIVGWADDVAPSLGPNPLPIEQNDVSRALAIRPDRKGFVLGTAFGLTAFDGEGSRRWTRPTPSDTRGVVFARSGEIIVAAGGDGTIRWYRWGDGQQLLALFVHAPSRRWVAWTPTGYYMTSPGGEDLIGWQVNRGWEQEADFYPALHFRDKFARPDVVRLVLKTLDEHEAVKQADAAFQARKGSEPPAERLGPLNILAPPGCNEAPPLQNPQRLDRTLSP